MEGSAVGVNAEPAAYGGAGGDDGAAINDDYSEDEHSSRPRPFGSDGERNKRRRTVSLDAGGGGGMDASAVDLVKSILKESKRNTDDVRILREKILVNELTANHQIALGEAAVARTKLQAEMEDGKAELQRMGQLMVTICFYFHCEYF